MCFPVFGTPLESSWSVLTDQRQIEFHRDRRSDVSADPAWETSVWRRYFVGVSEREACEDTCVRWGCLTSSSVRFVGPEKLMWAWCTLAQAVEASDLSHLHSLVSRSANITSLGSGSTPSLRNGLERQCSQTDPRENCVLGLKDKRCFWWVIELKLV